MGIPKMLSEPLLQAIIPGAGAAITSKYFNALVAGMNANNINTSLRIAHFLAQLGHESVDLRHPEEIADGSDYEGVVKTLEIHSPAMVRSSRDAG